MHCQLYHHRKAKEIQLQQNTSFQKQELVLFAPEEIGELAGKIEPINFAKNNEQKYLEYLKLINLMRIDLQRFNKRISEESLRKLLG